MDFVHKEEYRNRRILVVRHERLNDTYHNGYVTVVRRKQSQEPDYQDLQSRIDTVALTFSDTFRHSELNNEWGDHWYVGFDTAHIWNDANPETKTKDPVIEKARELCDEMVRKGI